MAGRTGIEVFGHIIFSFTRSVSEQYSPKDPEYSQETLEYDLLQNTGREWYSQPVDEIIYQEYSDTEVTVDDFLPASCRVKAVSLVACSLGDIEEQTEIQKTHLEQAMSWKQLRPSALRTVCKSTVVGASISLLSAIAIGMMFTMIAYLSYKTFLKCHFQPKAFIPLKLQWMQVTCNIISCFFLYIWVFLIALVLALNILFVMSIFGHNYLLTNHLCLHSKRQKRAVFMLFSVLYCLPFIASAIITLFIYTMYNKQKEKDKMIIALFSPLIGVIFKTTSRICIQRLWRITHPACSYVMMAPLYSA